MLPLPLFTSNNQLIIVKGFNRLNFLCGIKIHADDLSVPLKLGEILTEHFPALTEFRL